MNKDEQVTAASEEQQGEVSKPTQPLSMKERLGSALHKAKDTITQVAEHENTRAALEWSKKAAEELKNQAVELGQDITNSDLGKTSLRGAAVGAVAAVPIPIIGPVAGAIVGAGVGAYLHLKYGVGTGTANLDHDKDISPPQTTDEVLEDLKKLNALHQEKAITDQEFEQLKAKMMMRL